MDLFFEKYGQYITKQPINIKNNKIINVSGY